MTSFRIFGDVGILYIMFIAAVDIDMFHLKKEGRSGVIFRTDIISVPLCHKDSSVPIMLLDTAGPHRC